MSRYRLNEDITTLEGMEQALEQEIRERFDSYPSFDRVDISYVAQCAAEDVAEAIYGGEDPDEGEDTARHIVEEYPALIWTDGYRDGLEDAIEEQAAYALRHNDSIEAIEFALGAYHAQIARTVRQMVRDDGCDDQRLSPEDIAEYARITGQSMVFDNDYSVEAIIELGLAEGDAAQYDLLGWLIEKSEMIANDVYSEMSYRQCLESQAD